MSKQLCMPTRIEVDHALLKHRRQKMKLTQRELANRCRLQQRTISDVENGKVEPTINTLAIIAYQLGLPLSVCLCVYYDDILAGAADAGCANASE